MNNTYMTLGRTNSGWMGFRIGIMTQMEKFNMFAFQAGGLG